MRSLRIRLPLAAAVFGILALVVSPATVEAGRLKATIMMTQASVSRSLSLKKMLGFVRSHRTTRLRETNEAKLDERQFKAEMVTQFNAPPGDLEFHVLFYDVHSGPRNFVEDMSVFIDDRSQRVFVQRLKLPRPRFKPNRRMEMVVTVRRAEVGRLKFETLGEEKRRSGRVDFSADET